MTTNTEKPVGPGTFARDSYRVSIAEDGKILVNEGDWLSEYSWALYGDYDTLQVFVRPNPAITSPSQQINGIKEIEDVDLIKTGEYLIHEPTYFHWMEKRSKPLPPKPPKIPKPLKPEDVPTTHWMAADLGGLDAYMGAGGGVSLVAFLNLDTGTRYYYALIHFGGGFGWDPSDALDALKTSVRALGIAFFAKKAINATFIPVTCLRAVSARRFTGLNINCRGWKLNTGGPNKNYSYEKITGYMSSFDYFTVTFQGTDWMDIPGGNVHITGGKLVWIY
jgi:hypothetical protein